MTAPASTIAFDVASAGNNAAGPATNTLTTPWSHNAQVSSGVVFAGFSYDTSAPNSRSIERTITYGGEPMEMIRQVPKGYWPYTSGAPGYVELWGAVIAATGAETISVGLAYETDSGDPWAETSATFSNFKGGSVSYGGIDTWGPSSEHASSNKWISIPVSAFLNTFTIGVIGSDTPLDADFNQTTRFLDSTGQLLIGECWGNGAFKVQGGGGPWAAATVNLRPIDYLPDGVGNGVIW